MLLKWQKKVKQVEKYLFLKSKYMIMYLLGLQELLGEEKGHRMWSSESNSSGCSIDLCVFIGQDNTFIEQE
jgi:hypothetical protein